MRARTKAIASIIKSHGRLGEVVAVPVGGLPSLIFTGQRVALVPPELRRDRWHTVLSCSSDAREGALVRLSGVGSLAEAQAVVGKTVLALADDLPADFAYLNAEALVGREVACAALAGARSAHIAEVMRGPANDVWVLRGEKGELLLPITPCTVPELPDEGPIPVSVPGGLLWSDEEGR